jgi:flagellar hook-basal body complex protein FliE
MPDPISSSPLRPMMPVSPAEAPSRGEADRAGFASQLREQLEHVSRMQAEAEQSIEGLLTGETDNLTGVFTTARKAEVAFSLLMEIRNKLVDAYAELRQLRV